MRRQLSTVHAQLVGLGSSRGGGMIALQLVWRWGVVACVVALGSPMGAATAQTATIKLGGSPNVERLSNLPLDGYFYTAGIDIEQEMSRPYVYIPRWRDKSGFIVIDVADPRQPDVIYTWTIEEPELRVIGRGETGKYFKIGSRYYYAKSTVFARGTLGSDEGAIIFDVTGLPGASQVREIGRLRAPDIPDGFISLFVYKHSDGRTLLFGAQRNVFSGDQAHAKIYDMEKFIAGDSDLGLIAKVPNPDTPLKNTTSAYHDVYVAFDPATGQDKFYGGGTGGFYVYDVTRPEEPELVTSITNLGGVIRGHTIIASPDARYAVTQMEYQFSPLMIFDLGPGLRGEVPTIRRPVGAWIADWRDLSHNHEVRWPYIFAAAYEDGLQIIDAQTPSDPKTVGWYYTCECPHQTGFSGGNQLYGNSVFSGAMELDVRNADGLIVVSDLNTGFWAFRLNGFDGWDGQDWNLPNISSAQDWDHGPPRAR